MGDYLRQKSKYLSPIAAWVTTHGGLPRDIITFSIEFEETLYSLRSDPAALSSFLGESKVKIKLTKIITEGMSSISSLYPSYSYEKRSLLTRLGFTILGLQYYFTPFPHFPSSRHPLTHTPIAGEKEIRCWTIPKGCLAPQAAGAIHTDFERGFIEAEVVAYADFHDLCDGAESMARIKAAGKYRQEGGKYVCFPVVERERRDLL
jgi:obg-like ATPase 1